MGVTKDPRYIIGTLILLIIVGAFYWFQWRPMQIKKDCYKKSIVRHQDSIGILRAAGVAYDPDAPENNKDGIGRFAIADNKVASLGLPVPEKFVTYSSYSKRYEECLKENGF